MSSWFKSSSSSQNTNTPATAETDTKEDVSSSSAATTSSNINANAHTIKSVLVEMNIGGIATFTASRETVVRFAPHKLSQLMEDSSDVTAGCSFTKYRIFVDQDAHLFPYILKYLRAGHENASFLDELSETDLWNLYEQVRDFYQIAPLLKQLETVVFPSLTEEQVKKRQVKYKGYWDIIHSCMQTIGFPKKDEEVKAVDRVLDQMAANPLIGDCLDENVYQNEHKKRNNIRYDVRKAKINEWVKVGVEMATILGLYVASFFLNKQKQKASSADDEAKNQQENKENNDKANDDRTDNDEKRNKICFYTIIPTGGRILERLGVVKSSHENQKILIIGPKGSGKTVLCEKLISPQWPTHTILEKLEFDDLWKRQTGFIHISESRYTLPSVNTSIEICVDYIFVSTRSAIHDVPIKNFEELIPEKSLFGEYSFFVYSTKAKEIVAGISVSIRVSESCDISASEVKTSTTTGLDETKQDIKQSYGESSRKSDNDDIDETEDEKIGDL